MLFNENHARELDAQEAFAMSVRSDLAAAGIAGDTLVIHTATGWPLRLRDMAERHAGVVLTMRDAARLVPERPAAYVRTGWAQVYELASETGRRIEATAHRPLLTQSGWKPLIELEPTDRVAVIAEYPALFGKGDTDTARLKLLAYMTQTYVRVDGAIPVILDGEVRRDFEAAVEAVGDTHVQINDGQGMLWHQIWGRHGAPSRAREYLAVAGLTDVSSSAKVLPDYVYGLRQDKLRLLLHCLLTCDGSPARSGKIRYRTSSSGWARQVQHLLARFGIVAALVEARDEPGKIDLWIDHKGDVLRCLERIGFGGDKSLYAEWLRASLYDVRDAEEHAARVGPIWFDAIRSITPSRVAEVYDLELREARNFVAGEFVVRNEPSWH